MRVLLIQSYMGHNEEVVFPLGLCYIATALRNHNHEVSVYDPNVSIDLVSELKRVTRALEPTVIGIGLRNIDNSSYWGFHSYLDLFFEMVSLLKEEMPSAKILVGGPGFSIYAHQIMEQVKAIDYGIFAEGEESIPELLDNLDHPEGVKGIFYRRDGTVHFTRAREPLDFASLPAPRRDIADFTPYLKHPFSIGIQTKRGCVFKCSYCTYPHLEGRRLRLRPAKAVVDELESLTKQYGLHSFWFTDSVFNVPQSHASEICQEILDRELNIRWRCYHNEKFIDRQYLKLARDAGCTCFSFSPDGISSSTLLALNKESTEQDIEKVYSLAKQLDDVKVSFNFFINGPGEGPRNLFRLFTFFFRSMMRLRGKVNFVPYRLGCIRIYPHTLLHALALEKGLVKEHDDLLEPVFYNPPPLQYILPIIRPGVRIVLRVGRWLRRLMSGSRRGLI